MGFDGLDSGVWYGVGWVGGRGGGRERGRVGGRERGREGGG